jgi:SAM-dependent methyltransferase
LTPIDETLQDLEAQLEAGRPDAAIAGAWRLFDVAPDKQQVKLLLLDLLSQHSELATPDNQSALQKLLNDPTIDPREVTPTGWKILRLTDSVTPGSSPEATASWLEADEFAQSLLRQNYVSDLEIEIALTAMRRWLLLSGRWPEFPRTTEALVEQAAQNGGAWLFDSEERACLDADPSARIAQAFRPRRPERLTPVGFAEPTTHAVAEQYEGWPYPDWTRVTQVLPTTLAATVRKYDPDGPDTIPAQPNILIAGCGTGSEPAGWALKYPDAKITAIDISRTSLAYARERCAAAGLDRIEFRLLPINRVAELGREFDAISCSGVLHHLPNPEDGWAALTDVLKPGGVIRVMVYSKLARLLVRHWRNSIADLLDHPVDDDLVRDVRRRLIDKGRAPVWRDFFTIGGVHDLLLHRHEDPFDVQRIRRNVERLGLALLRFQLPTAIDKADYRRENPQDALFRDFSLWTAFELRQPLLFAGMYHFWCRKPLEPSRRSV